jgi:hypothetical protein
MYIHLVWALHDLEVNINLYNIGVLNGEDFKLHSLGLRMFVGENGTPIKCSEKRCGSCLEVCSPSSRPGWLLISETVLALAISKHCNPHPPPQKFQ